MLVSSTSASIAVVLLLTQWTGSTIAAQCYFSDGSKADSSFQPCFPDQYNSPCCANNKPKGMANDLCLTSGLCLAQMQGFAGMIYQNGCTDQTGKSSQCQAICSDSTSGGIHLLPCPAKGTNKWCCSINGTDCCDNAATVSIGTIYGYTSISASSASSSTSTATGTGTIATTTVTTTAAAGSGTEVCSDSSSKATAVGAGIGAGLGTCLVATLFALWFQRRMYQKKLQQTSGYAGYSPASMAYAQSGYSNPSSGVRRNVSELQSNQEVIHEADGQETRK
ncbi:hypothetical protein LV164_006369 [Aspergillus fumigatus]|nr:hypothetical protein KXX42_001535 [Aspergillus fumigatus]KAH1547981.1 hypothetical protein KXX57_002120 [Aspergillus fumigatus]KAH1977479.1 hypothetical protein KXW88_008394 [Aspergillus fumigatus]KAH2303363.1 hypothetical protein KXV47_000556 [Aspergillus fumigatus]KAH2658307.1 hypothetical protein KXV32_001744 [Aspergillus fumigatus]